MVGPANQAADAEAKAAAEAAAKAEAEAKAKAEASGAATKGALVVLAAAVVLRLLNGSDQYLYKGAPVATALYDKDSVKHAQSIGLIGKSK